MALFPTIIDDPRHSLVVFQSSIAQTSLPIIRNILTAKNSSRKILLFSLQYPPSFFLSGLECENLEIHDLLDHVPGYDDASPDIQVDILAKISAGAFLRFFEDRSVNVLQQLFRLHCPSMS